MLRGINTISIDTKGRVAVPTKYRELLGSSLVVTIDTEEPCLLLYPVSEWQLIEEKLQKLPSFNASVRRIQRLLIGYATDIEIDNNGRVLLAPMLRKYANLEEKAVLIGQYNKLEIWDESMWHKRSAEWLTTEGALREGLPPDMETFYL